MKRLPIYFLSHGAPTMALCKDPKETVLFLNNLGKKLSSLKGIINAILCISAHWESNPIAITSSDTPSMIYDFYGFQKELYEIKYPLKGNKEISSLVAETLNNNGVEARLDSKRGIDHGTWVLLVNMFPDGNIPVIQVSLNSDLDFREHVKIGEALKELRDKGVLILCSGGAVHNLRDVDFDEKGSKHVKWAEEFDLVLKEAVESKSPSLGLLKMVETNKELLKKAHPRTEHLMPIFVMAGALFDGEKVEQIHSNFQFESLSLACYGTKEIKDEL